MINIRNKNLALGRHSGVSTSHSSSKMSLLASMPLSTITSSLLPSRYTPHPTCLPETPLIYCASQSHSSAHCHPETLSHSMAPTDSMLTHRDTVGHQDTQSPDTVGALEAPETAISIGGTGERHLYGRHRINHALYRTTIMAAPLGTLDYRPQYHDSNSLECKLFIKC